MSVHSPCFLCLPFSGAAGSEQTPEREQIQIAGDIGPTIVASGMKVALITTIFGIVVALILQLFYSYITSKIEHLTSQMEESVVTLLDIIMKYKHG